jgi:tetratricopeptide (TPR) repeat protein
MRKYLLTIIAASLFYLGAHAQTEKEIGQLYAQRKYEQALEASRNFLSNNPNNADVNMLAGTVYFDEVKYDSALPYLYRALSLDSELMEEEQSRNRR